MQTITAFLETKKHLLAPTPKRGRPAKYAQLGTSGRLRATHSKNPFALDGKIAPTLERLAEQFDCTQTEVVNHLLRYALTNRDWVKQGMTGWNKVDRRFANGKRPVATLSDDLTNEVGMFI
jgi:hypothetical protein